MFLIITLLFANTVFSQLSSSGYAVQCRDIDSVRKAISSMTIYNNENGYEIAIIGCVIYQETVSSSFIANNKLFTISYPISPVGKILIEELNITSFGAWHQVSYTLKSFDKFVKAIISMTHFTENDIITPIKYFDYKEETGILENSNDNTFFILRFLIFKVNDKKFLIIYPLAESSEKIAVRLSEFK